MLVKHKDGVTSCVLNATEQAGINRAIATCDQLAYHYRNSDLGDSMEGVVSALYALIEDTEIAPCGAVAK